MKNVHWIVASMFVGLLAAGCIGTTSEPEPGEESLGEAQQELPSGYTTTYYYSTAAKTTQVGYCYTPSICSGANTVCSGQKTAYHDSEYTSCL